MTKLHTSLIATLCAVPTPAQGSVSFSPDPTHTVFATTAVPSDGVCLADLNGDGNLDAALGGPVIQWGMTSGFGDAIELLPPLSGHSGFVTAPLAADFDRDGDIDLLQFRPNSAHSIWVNDGTGSFTEESASRLPNRRTGGATRAAAIDIDGDGDLDVISDLGHLWINRGNGTWGDQTLQRVTGATSTNSPGIVRVLDADGDGDEDVVLHAGLLRNTGGAFVVEDALGRLMIGVERAVPIDADRDGDVDLALSDGTLLLNDGTGTFAAGGQAPIGAIAAGDLDGDGAEDLVLVDSGSLATPRIGWASAGSPFFGTVRSLAGDLPAADLAAGSWRASVVDVDGDGDLDITSSVNGPHRLTPMLVWINDGVGGFQPAFDLFLPTVSESASRTWCDVDGDGLLDLVAESQVLTRRNGGRWVETGSLPPGRWLVSATGDLDADGDLDLVVSPVSPIPAVTAELHLNDGAGNFAQSRILPHASATTYRVADWDGDGDDDLLAFSDRLEFFENRGPQGLAQQTLWLLPAGVIGRDFAVADLDDDGRIDVVPLLRWANGSSLYDDFGALFQEADGSLTLTWFQNVARIDGVELSDLNGDGRPDVAATSVFGPACFHPNLGARTFGASRPLPRGPLEFADLDQDGDLDAILAGANVLHLHDHPTWHANDGAGGFGPLQVIDDPRLPPLDIVAIDVVDLDADGDPDFVSNGYDASSPTAPERLHTYWNLSRQLRTTALSALGGDLTAEIAHALGPTAPGLLALPWVSLGRGSQTLPGIGIVRIDGASAVALPFAPFRGTTVARTALPIPRIPAVAGLEVYLQAFIVGTPSGAVELTNVATDRLQR